MLKRLEQQKNKEKIETEKLEREEEIKKTIDEMEQLKKEKIE